MFYKKVFFKISQNVEDNICVGFFFLIKLQAGGLRLHQIETPEQMFYCEF